MAEKKERKRKGKVHIFHHAPPGQTFLQVLIIKPLETARKLLKRKICSGLDFFQTFLGFLSSPISMSLLWICRRLFFSLSIDELPFASFNFDNFFVRFSLFFLSLFLTFHDSYFFFKVKLMYIALFGIFGFWLLKQR